MIQHCTFALFWRWPSKLPERVGPSFEKIQNKSVPWYLSNENYSFFKPFTCPGRRSWPGWRVPRWRVRWCRTGLACRGPPASPERERTAPETRNQRSTDCPTALLWVVLDFTDNWKTWERQHGRSLKTWESCKTHVFGRKLSWRCWNDGDGVTASRADWFTRAAVSWKIFKHF